MKKLLFFLFLPFYLQAQMCKVNGQNWSVYDPSKEPTNKTIPGFPPNEEKLYRLVNSNPQLLEFGRTKIHNQLGKPKKEEYNPMSMGAAGLFTDYYEGLELSFDEIEREKQYEMLTITGKDFFISNKFKLQVGECIPYELLRDHKYQYFKEETAWINYLSWTIVALNSNTGLYQLVDEHITIKLDSNGRITQIYRGP